MLTARGIFHSPRALWVAVFKSQHRHASSQNYYEVLKLKRDCTHEEIRKAYIIRSKELHPDLNPKDPDSHKKIVQVNEAYKVLGKPSSRRQYDDYLSNPSKVPVYRSPVWNTQPPDTTRGWNWYQSSAWDARRMDDPPYYGIKGIKRIPTKWIAFGCVIIAIFSGGIQLFSLRYRQVHVSQHLDARDEALATWWKESKERAEEAGTREEQLAMWEQRHAGDYYYCPQCAEEAANQ